MFCSNTNKINPRIDVNQSMQVTHRLDVCEIVYFILEKIDKCFNLFDWVFLSVKIKIKSVTYTFNIKDAKQIEISLTYKMIIMLSVVSNEILKYIISDYL